MSSQKVTELRKQGKLKEALELAQENLAKDSNNIWNKRAISWVFYSLLKKAAENEEQKSFVNLLGEIEQLGLGEDEAMLFNNVALQIGLFLYKQKDVKPLYLDHVFEKIKAIPFTKKEDSYTFIIKAFKKHAAEWDGFLSFVEWWNLDSFQEKDYEKFVLENGKKIPSVVESIYIAVAKKLLQYPVNIETVKEFVPKIAYVSKHYPNMQYTPYYYAKLLLVLGDKSHFMQAFLPFAKKKQRDFWVWDLMSEVFDKSSKEYFSCLCKSLNCKAPDMFTGNVREKITEVLIKNEQYCEAKYELLNIIETRKKEGWALKAKHAEWQNYPWWNAAKIPGNNFALYKNNLSIAEGLLYADIAEELMVVERVNEEKTVLHFIVSKQKYGLIFYGKFNIKPHIGEVYALRFARSDKPQKSSFYQIQSITISDKTAPKEVYKQVVGRIMIKQGNSFGFVENVYVSSQVINKYQLKDGAFIKGKAICSFNARRKAWGWSVVSVDLK